MAQPHEFVTSTFLLKGAMGREPSVGQKFLWRGLVQLTLTINESVMG
jgi:hypothetical protein